MRERKDCFVSGVRKLAGHEEPENATWPLYAKRFQTEKTCKHGK